MIDIEVYAQIRQCKKNGLSARKTAEALGISRNTVKRYWHGAHTPDEKKAYPAQVDSPQKEAVMEALEKYYNENQHLLTGKQRINAKTAWKAIRESYAVGESTVRRYVREIKGKKPQGFIPLSFEPGEVMQVDWNEVKVNVGGHLWKAPVFCAVLPYSYGIFAMVMPNMQMPCFIEAHTEAFNFFGGVPQRVFYDNLRTAVFSGTGKNAVKQERFRMLEAHYAFEAVFMNPNSGNEKGSVENLCSLIRQVAFVPIPRGKNLHEIQEQVLRRCLDYIRFHKIRDRPMPIAPMLEEERPRLMPLPLKTFSAYAETESVVGSDLTFRYDATKYSVPQEYIGKTVAVRATSYRLEAWHKGVLICTHERPFAKGEHRYLPEHYLPLLEKRPRAIPNAAPLKYGALPSELEKFRSLNTAKDKYEQLANVLLLGRQFDAETLLRAVHYANRTGSPSLETVRFYLQAHSLSGDNQGKDAAALADAVIVDNPRLDDYDILFMKDGEYDE
jgi:transposase